MKVLRDGVLRIAQREGDWTAEEAPYAEGHCSLRQ